MAVQQTQQQSFCSRSSGQGGDTKLYPAHLHFKLPCPGWLWAGQVVPASALDASVTCCPLPAGTGVSDPAPHTSGQHTPNPSPHHSQGQCQGSLLSSSHPRQPAPRPLRRKNSFLHRSVSHHKHLCWCQALLVFLSLVSKDSLFFPTYTQIETQQVKSAFHGISQNLKYLKCGQQVRGGGSAPLLW